MENVIWARIVNLTPANFNYSYNNTPPGVLYVLYLVGEARGREQAGEDGGRY